MAESWLEQQAKFEVLIPLILPTFVHWPSWDKELAELAQALQPERKALLIDFRYYMNQRLKWNNVIGRDLEKFCRGEDVSPFLELGEKTVPWLGKEL